MKIRPYRPTEKRYNLYYGERDKKLIESMTFESMHIVTQQTIVYYSIDETMKPNIYNEVEKKVFRAAVELYARVQVNEPDDKVSEHGIDRVLTMEAYLMRDEMLQTIKMFPKVGDYIEFDKKFFEVYKVDDVKYRYGLDDEKFQIKVLAYMVRQTQFDFGNIKIVKGGHSAVPPR